MVKFVNKHTQFAHYVSMKSILNILHIQILQYMYHICYINNIVISKTKTATISHYTFSMNKTYRFHCSDVKSLQILEISDNR